MQSEHLLKLVVDPIPKKTSDLLLGIPRQCFALGEICLCRKSPTGANTPRDYGKHRSSAHGIGETRANMNDEVDATLRQIDAFLRDLNIRLDERGTGLSRHHGQFSMRFPCLRVASMTKTSCAL